MKFSFMSASTDVCIDYHIFINFEITFEYTTILHTTKFADSHVISCLISGENVVQSTCL